MYPTDYHTKYFAHELTERCAFDCFERLAGAVLDAQIDLNRTESKLHSPRSSPGFPKAPFWQMKCVWGRPSKRVRR
jgi:hypothetical protein